VAKPSKPKAALPPIRADQVTFAKLGKPQKTANRQTVRKELLGAAVAAKKKQTKVKALPVLAPPPEPMAPPPVPNLEPVAEPWVHVGNVCVPHIHI
jgi:hypothetical protein